MEHSTEKKLKNLLDLQAIDSKIFEIKKVRGALPDEVQDLEDELVGYNTRLDNFNSDIEEKNKDIDDLKNKSSEAKKLIKKYKDQQMNVRNNREYDAISKEIELQELDSKIFVKYASIGGLGVTNVCATPSSFHSCPETMATLAFDHTGLEGSFHDKFRSESAKGRWNLHL